MRTINYCFTHKQNSYHNIAQHSPFGVNGVSFPLQPLIETADSNLIYKNCPVWSHKASRTFVVRSAIEFNIIFHSNKLSYVLEWPETNKLPMNDVLHLDPGWNDAKSPVIQVMHPTLAFWTKDKNIWYEVRPHAPTVVNNFYAVGGWFNISNWRRTSAFGMHIIDTKKPVTVKRGDPLFEICFYSNNLDDKYKMVQHDSIPDDEYKKMISTSNVKTYLKGFTKNLFTKEEKSKCPFAFLFNK